MHGGEGDVHGRGAASVAGGACVAGGVCGMHAPSAVTTRYG